jgi:hypothetical protein
MQPVYTEVGSVSFDSYQGKSCGEKSWKQKTKEFTYTVPKGVKGVIRICAFADDFAGNTGKACVDLSTGDRWTGMIQNDSTGNYGAPGTYSNEKWKSIFDVVVEADGSVVGPPRRTSLRRLNVPGLEWNT